MVTRQITPKRLDFLGRSVDECVDRLASDDAQPGFVPRLQPTRDLLGRPSLGEAIADKTAEIFLSFEDRFTPPAQHIGSAGVKRRIPAGGERVPPQLPGDGGFRATERPGDYADRMAGGRKIPIWSLSSSDRCQ